ncbi:MAG: hypothetical protein R3F18_11310 [Lysobacterales bacterium]
MGAIADVQIKPDGVSDGQQARIQRRITLQQQGTAIQQIALQITFGIRIPLQANMIALDLRDQPSRRGWWQIVDDKLNFSLGVVTGRIPAFQFQPHERLIHRATIKTAQFPRQHGAARSGDDLDGRGNIDAPHAQLKTLEILATVRTPEHTDDASCPFPSVRTGNPNLRRRRVNACSRLWAQGRGVARAIYGGNPIAIAAICQTRVHVHQARAGRVQQQAAIAKHAVVIDVRRGRSRPRQTHIARALSLGQQRQGRVWCLRVYPNVAESLTDQANSINRA